MKMLKNILPSLVSVAIGLLLGLVLLFIAHPADALGGLGLLFQGGYLEGASGLGRTLYAATPMIMAGLSVGLAMRSNLFNIGAPGQFTAGAFCAIAVGVKLSMLPFIVHVTLAVLAGTLAGMIWGLLSGALKAYCKVNEVISGIMLNYVVMLLANLLIKSYFYNSTFNRSADIAPSATLPSGILDGVLPNSQVGAGFVVALIMVAVVKVLLDRTTLGYELKVSGLNPFAASYAGISSKKSILVSMALAGALAGMGGALMYLSDFGDHLLVVETILPQGFTGISVALLGMSNPLGILVAGVFIAHITVGGTYLQLLGFTPEIVDMIIAVIVFCGALVIPIRLLLERFAEKRRKEDR